MSFGPFRGKPVAATIFQRLCACRSITSSLATRAKKMPDRPALINEDEFTEVFLKGSGPGGQKINKTSSAVQLRHLPTGIVLKVQETRSRAQNRKIAREKLALRVEQLQKGEESRLAVLKATKTKRKASATKKSHRKYRLLSQAKEEGADNQPPEIAEA
ncbi:Peptidyl-tRNA hydrolase domain containing protein [Blumeria hordei DH14]|uniref:Peptidyl-tRNA hydrolase domain containing protein n=1 Tax=Blumeria graminis f. sp. hordei (strain DH14) TaxID=546991 RepID=N1JB01_BLUG1|nr:Peptidyl-tRNA hydrolase domain containing protein [Blumeria hordei DH14]